LIFGDKGGYIFLEHNSGNFKKTDFKDVQISSWDYLDKPPFWWSFDPKTVPYGEFFLFSRLYIGDFVSSRNKEMSNPAEFKSFKSFT